MENTSNLVQNTPQQSTLKSSQLIEDSELPCITISAVCYHSEIWLPSFLNSLVNLEYPLEKISIVFVDHSSNLICTEIIETFIEKYSNVFKQIDIYQLPNRGYGAGNDFAISKTEDKFVLVTNIDLEFDPACLKKLAHHAVLDEDDIVCWETRQVPHEHPKYFHPDTFVTNWVSHTCVLIKVSAYHDIGGYEQKIFMYGEDVELSFRFRAAGNRLKYVRDAIVFHKTEIINVTQKPRYFSGIISTNILLRYRYGTIKDMITGELLLHAFWFSEKSPEKRTALKDAKDIISKHRRYFYKTRLKPRHITYLFNEFDYD